ncbi:MAG: bifunctional lysine ketoglutarate reductase /saccharopine dehydrogenase family protein [Elusimicrobia bacterium]|nr:bifunctional lysine ketoglutarate reductase /saccharopine dehydrogenase family protein [Elusimicrobiota bacterium]
MSRVLGIRREDKNPWERRVPIIPEHVAALVKGHGIEVLVQRSDLRAIPAEEYVRAGARIVDDLSPCDIVFAVKEIPIPLLQKGQTYVFFSHTIKGQSHNMPMLRRMLELGCTLIDYERMVDEKGKRLVFFGKYAGLAGMIDTLWALGQRLAWEKTSTPLSAVKRALDYASLAEAESHIAEAGQMIASGGLAEPVTPLVVGFTGYGNVSQGAQQILGRLPTEEVSPADLPGLFAPGASPRKDRIYKVVFREEHLVEPAAAGSRFELQDYYQNPERYRSQFEKYIPYLTVLVNCIYWEAKYPRLVTKAYLKKAFGQGPTPRLRVIGDITCDTEGSIECNIKTTDPGRPVFTYDPLRGRAKDGCFGKGPVVLAVDNLPAELPRESSREFSQSLFPFLPELALADLSADFEACALSRPMKKAMIAQRGELTPDFRYLSKFLAESAAKK